MAFDLGAMLADVSKMDTARVLTKVRVQDIYPDPDNFYTMDAESIQELANSIQTVGLMDPITVRKHPDMAGCYMVISGHRRRAALELLATEYDKFKTVDVFVDNSDSDPDMVRLKLIFGNSCTRHLNSWEMSKQAEEVEKLLYSLAKKGMKFEGRMRDHVAKVCEISASKLARLKVIRENLAPEMRQAWESGKLNEDAAYTLAKLPAKDQVTIGKSAHIGFVNHSSIDKMNDMINKIRKYTCEECGGKCSHIQDMIHEVCKTSPYSLTWCDRAGCCKTCEHLSQCRNSCKHADAVKVQAAEEKKQIDKEIADNKAKKVKPFVDFTAEFYDRLIGLCDDNGINTLEDWKTKTGIMIFGNHFDEWGKLSEGTGVTEYTGLPFGYSVGAKEVMNMCAAADALGCSVDYLLGRTPVKMSAPTWQTGTPSGNGQYLAGVDWGSGRENMTVLDFVDGKWNECGTDISNIGTVRRWIPVPGKDA